MPITLFDLLWDDILIPHVASRLSIKSLYNLSKCSKQSKKFVKLAFQSKRKLFDLNLCEDDQVIEFLSENYTNLDELQCMSCITNDLIPFLENNKNLRILYLDMIQLKDYYKKFTKKIKLLQAIRSMKNLVELRLDTGYKMTEGQLISVYRSLINLKVITTNEFYTDNVIKAITKNCRQLERLDLSKTKKKRITEIGIK